MVESSNKDKESQHVQDEQIEATVNDKEIATMIEQSTQQIDDYGVEEESKEPRPAQQNARQSDEEEKEDDAEEMADQVEELDSNVENSFKKMNTQLISRNSSSISEEEDANGE